ncbi:MAG: tRNA (adenosine(37)-N6)-threonylcarbamoyltransferase complex dimerization subunit type 1 TsaB [Planctomycetota bacterium]
MKLVAIETAESPGTLAALQSSAGGEPSLVAHSLPADQRTAQSLAVGIRKLLGEVGWATNAIDAVAVTTGPGSFTGLRLGVTAAKTLAYAAGAVCVPINTLAVLAAQATATRGWAVLDAQRRELFAAEFVDHKLGGEPAIVPEDAWIAGLKEGDYVVGPILSRLADRLPDGVQVATESAWRPLAETVAGLAIEAFGAGRTVSPMQLTPNYYRLSAAEEKLQAKE